MLLSKFPRIPQPLNVFIFLLLVLAASLSSCEVAEAIIAIDEGTIELKVMTYNIYHADPDGPDWKKWKNRKTQIVQNIEMIRPDVFGVQEALIGQIDFLHENLPEYGWYGFGRDDGDEEGEHVAIFYLKERFQVGDRDTFWFSNHPDEPGTKPGEKWGNPSHPRICSWVRLTEIETGKTFYVFNLHLEHGDHGKQAREKSVELLGKRIAAREHPYDPFIVMGDFNAKSTSDAIEYLVDELGYVDTFAELNEDLDEGYTHGNWGGSKKRIDYIFSHPDALFVDSKVIPWNGSDHYPLYTILQLIAE